MKVLCFVCIFSVTFLAVAATPAADTNAENQVIQAALQPSALESNLHRLTDEIGGRVPGTLAMTHAVEWGVEAFTAAGADAVAPRDSRFPTPGRKARPK